MQKAQEMLQGKERNRNEEETLRNLETLSDLLISSEEVLIDLHKEKGPTYVTMAMTELSRAQRAAAKRLKEMCISTVKSTEVADKVREDNLSDAEFETARQVEVAERKLNKKKPNENGRGGYRGRSRGSGRGRGRGRGYARGGATQNVQFDNNGEEKTNEGNGAEGIKCYNCNVKGHMARDCPKPHRSGK